MKDRISRYPGRVTLTPVEGQPDTYDMARADDPVEVGTPLNKASLISDPTASLYRLGADATPDSVFRAAPGLINSAWAQLVSYTRAGSYTWSAPNLFLGKAYKIGVLVIGGGGSGGVASRSTGGISSWYLKASGGASGYTCAFLKTVTPGERLTLVVGAGGAAVSGSTANGIAVNGNAGGSSAAAGVSALGGSGGNASSSSYGFGVAGASGAQCSSAVSADAGLNPFGGEIVQIYITQGSSNSDTYNAGNPAMCFNPFAGERILGAGAWAVANVGSASMGPPGKSEVSGKGGGNAAAGTSGTTIRAGAADTPGSGGGAAVLLTPEASLTATSGKGADGAVIIYVQGVAG